MLDRIAKRNPGFKHFSGSITDIYANECMRSFLNLRIYQNETEAGKEMKRKLYEPAILSEANIILNSCDSAAILFTSTETETFPLLYLQEIKRLRKDVLVVYTPLLSSRDYILSLSHDNQYAMPMLLSFSRDQVNALADYFITDKNTGNTVSEASLLMKQLALPDQKFRDVLFKSNYSLLPSRRYTFKGVEISFPVNDILFLNDIIFLDLLSNDLNIRPLHLTATPNKEIGTYYDRYLLKKGSLRKWTVPQVSSEKKRKSKK